MDYLKFKTTFVVYIFITFKITIMKNQLLLSLIVLSLFLSSCAVVRAPMSGSIYTDMKAPLTATSNPVGSKVGSSEALGILGIVATGDASIQAAAKKAGITKISHVDYKAYSILGLFARYTVYVYGE